MYITRFNFSVRWGKEIEVFDTLKKISREQGAKGRVYMNSFGDNLIITSELEYEDAAAAAEERDKWFTGNVETSFDLSEWNDAVTGLTVDLFYAENY